MVHSTEWALTVSTPRLCLRPLDPDEAAPDVLRMRASPQVSKFLHASSEPIPSLASVKAILESRVRTNLVFFAIELRASPAFPPGVPLPKHQQPSAWAAHPPPAGSTEAYIDRSDQKIIGTVGVTDADELGYVIDEPWWGMGLATEAVTATIAQWEHSVVATERFELKAVVNSANMASVKVIEKCGFQRDGVTEVDDWGRPGKKFELWAYTYKRKNAAM